MSARSPGTLAARFPGPSWVNNRTGTCEQPIETLLEQLDRSSADLAREAARWILPEGASLAQLGQVELQEFLWYQLPLKWMAEITELHEIAWALADLFAVAGLDRYAALCRDPRTHLLLDAWQDDDHEPARKVMQEAIRSSGVAPPDTPLLSWGSVLGAAENSARRRVSQALEQAVDAGQLVPGERGWKQLAARLTEVSLTMPTLELRGGTLLQAVFRERGQRWASGYPALRQGLLTPLLPVLAGEIFVPAEAEACLTPLRWLLEHFGDSVTLTQAGWLPTALVLEASDTFAWFDVFGFKIRSQADLPELVSLNDLARRAGLITQRGRRVSLSASGRRALGDPGMLWRIVVADIFSAGTYEGEGAALAAATLLRTSTPVPRPTTEARVAAGLQGRWRPVSAEELEEWSGLDATREFGLLADIFGWLEPGDNWQNRTWRLTLPGRQAALMGLQLQSRASRKCF